MITVPAAAHCHRCDWAITGSWPDVDRQAERHTKVGHSTITEARPV